MGKMIRISGDEVMSVDHVKKIDYSYHTTDGIMHEVVLHRKLCSLYKI